MAKWKRIHFGSMRLQVQSLASLGWGSGAAMSCGVGRRCGLDSELLWLWCGPVAISLIQPLAWKHSYAAGGALKSKKKKKN